MFNFEKLEAWQRAVDFADLVYATTRGFPREELFGLAMQMRRAAVSVSSNLAEGSSRSSRADFSRFTEIATGLLFEVDIPERYRQGQGLLSEKDFLSAYEAAEKLGRMLSGLRTSLLS